MGREVVTFVSEIQALLRSAKVQRIGFFVEELAGLQA